MQSRTYAKKECGLAKTSSGFTLIEIMVVVALIGILSVIAIPNFNSYIAKRYVRGVVNELATSVKLARSEAQASGRNVSICAIDPNNPEQCGAGGNDWSEGWMVYVVGANPAVVQKVVKVYQVNSPNLTVNVAGPVGGVMTITPAGLSSPGTVIKVRPGNAPDPVALGKTMTYTDVTLELSVTDGV